MATLIEMKNWLAGNAYGAFMHNGGDEMEITKATRLYRECRSSSLDNRWDTLPASEQAGLFKMLLIVNAVCVEEIPSNELFTSIKGGHHKNEIDGLRITITSSTIMINGSALSNGSVMTDEASFKAGYELAKKQL